MTQSELQNADSAVWTEAADTVREALTSAETRGFVVLPRLLSPYLVETATPASWADVADPFTAFDNALRQFGSALGDPLTWAHQQDGRVVHNLVPSPGHENTQTGAGSSTELSLHTEDAFHPDRANLLVLACVRNPGGVGTYVAAASDVRLSEEDWALLEQPSVAVIPDESYGYQPGPDDVLTGVASSWRVEGRRRVRYDPAFSHVLESEKFRLAYERLESQFQEVRSPVALEPGDVVVLDNDAVVHGRAPFTAKFDGTDRWLKRILVRVPWVERPKSEQDEHGYGQTPRVADWTVA